MLETNSRITRRVTLALQRLLPFVATVLSVALPTADIDMRSFVVSEGRLFALKPSEWSMLLSGVALCGLLALLSTF